MHVFRLILNNIQPWMRTQNSPVGLISTSTVSGRVTVGTCCWFLSHWDYAGDNGHRSLVSRTDADCQLPTHHSGSSSMSHGTGGSSTFLGRETHPKARLVQLFVDPVWWVDAAELSSGDPRYTADVVDWYTSDRKEGSSKAGHARASL